MNDIKKWAEKIVQRLRQSGFLAYFAGGCVRDHIMGIQPADYDIATNAATDQIKQLFHRTVEVGVEYGVILVIHKSIHCQVSTFRTKTNNPQDDALKRDFTINGLFYDPREDKLFDWVDGIKDIEKKIIRAIGSPQDRFTEDPLRLLRAVRLASTLDFKIEKNTMVCIKKNALSIITCSEERIRDELINIFSGKNLVSALKLLKSTGLLYMIIPQIKHKKLSAYKLSEKILSLIETPDYRIGISGILCGLGFDYPENNIPSTPNFSEMNIFLIKMKFSNKDKLVIYNILKNHLRFINQSTMKISEKIKLMQSESFLLELEFHKLHLKAVNKPLNSYTDLKILHESLSHEEIFPTPLISGDELIDMGYKPSKNWKSVFNMLEIEQLEKNISTKQQTINWIKSPEINDLLSNVTR